MDVVKPLRAGAYSLVALVVIGGLTAGPHSFLVVDLVYVAGALVAILALMAGVKGATRRQARVVVDAAVTLLLAISCIAVAAHFVDCRRDLFRVSEERVLGEEGDAPGKPSDRPPGK